MVRLAPFTKGKQMFEKPVDPRLDCDRLYAKYHGDDDYVKLDCTCGECANSEAAYDWLDWLAEQHPELDNQVRWYDLVAMYGYDLPARIWKHVKDQMSEWQAQDAAMAERDAGWDPNP